VRGFVTTSVSAYPPLYPFVTFQPDNPHVRYFESGKRDYSTIKIEPERITTRFRSVGDATSAKASVTLKSLVVENGRPGAIPA